MAEAIDFKQIGTRPVRQDGVEKVTGRARFGADLILPNMVHGKVLRSPYAHARIKSVDVSAALAIDGVFSAICGADLPPVEPGSPLADTAKNTIARDKVVYHGQAVAAVSAASPDLAERALEAIKVDYEPLPPVLDVVAAMSEDSVLVDEDNYTNLPEKPEKPSNLANIARFERGDLEVGFGEADFVIEREYKIPMVHQGYIEPHACVANIDETGKGTVWCCTQGHFEFRTAVAGLLKKNVSDLTFVPSEIGGGFGGKLVAYLEPLAVLLSEKAGRPVKMAMSREDVFRATGPTSGTVIRIKLGMKNDGTIAAAHSWMAYEAGAFAGGQAYAPGAMSIFAPYDIDNFLVESYDVLVNKPKVAAYRAPGAPQSMHAFECAIDEAAIKLGMDPLDLRLKNAADEGTQAPYGPKFPAIGMKACIEAAKNHPNYKAPVPDGAARGVAAGFWFNIGMQSSAEININEDGSVMVVEGSPDIGGSRASMSLMAAETLGVDYEQVSTRIADTESTGFCNSTAGSRTTFATGMAVVQACEDVIAECKKRAAMTWGVDEDQVEWKDGQVEPAPGVNADVTPLSLAQLAGSAGRTGGPIQGRAAVNAQGAGATFSINFCDVRVDKETGKVDVLGYTAIQDAGKAIHPSYVEGQMQGGAAQGIGWALNEEFIYNAEGVLENPGFLDYRVPVASDLPMIDTEIVEVPNPVHPYGVRGVGETPITAPLPTVANAVSRSAGVRISDLPLSPPNILAALDE